MSVGLLHDALLVHTPPPGYSTELVPSVDCWGINILVTFHIICAALIDTMLMSLVFSRSVSAGGVASSQQLGSGGT
jgi:hypothetical protein